MKVAILHYWFLSPGGGEQVVRSLLKIYPEADLFCLFADKAALAQVGILKKPIVSFLNKIPYSRRINRHLFPLFPAAVSSFDFSSYDLILTSDSPPVKSIIGSLDSVHVSYTHTPGRFIWDLTAEFGLSLNPWLRPLYFIMASLARDADFIAAQRVDHFIANSTYVARRISKYYRRSSTVIYPPVDTETSYLGSGLGGYYLYVGRLIMNKRVDILIRACNILNKRLIIAGTGRDEDYLKSLAGTTIEFSGRVSDQERSDLYANCRALLFAADEDFGIVPVEAQSFGRPVIAYGKGGILETVLAGSPLGREYDTGLLFFEQDAASVAKAILSFEQAEEKFNPASIRAHALSFDRTHFETRMSNFLSSLVAEIPPALVCDPIKIELASLRN